MKWRKCSEELPDGLLMEDCLVRDVNGDMGVGYYRADAKAWDSCNFGWLEYEDTAPRDNDGNLMAPCRLGTIVEFIPIEEIEKAISLRTIEKIKKEIRNEPILRGYGSIAKRINVIIDNTIKEESCGEELKFKGGE